MNHLRFLLESELGLISPILLIVPYIFHFFPIRLCLLVPPLNAHFDGAVGVLTEKLFARGFGIINRNQTERCAELAPKKKYTALGVGIICK